MFLSLQTILEQNCSGAHHVLKFFFFNDAIEDIASCDRKLKFQDGGCYNVSIHISGRSQDRDEILTAKSNGYTHVFGIKELDVASVDVERCNRKSEKIQDGGR